MGRFEWRWIFCLCLLSYRLCLSFNSYPIKGKYFCFVAQVGFLISSFWYLSGSFRERNAKGETGYLQRNFLLPWVVAPDKKWSSLGWGGEEKGKKSAVRGGLTVYMHSVWKKWKNPSLETVNSMEPWVSIKFVFKKQNLPPQLHAYVSGLENWQFLPVSSAFSVNSHGGLRYSDYMLTSP